MSSDQVDQPPAQRPAQDHVDHILERWAQVRPELDVSPMGVIGRISRLSRFLERSIANVLAGYGLNEPQFAVLAALRRAGPPHCLSPTELYSALLVSSGAMTNRLDRLATLGFVRRVSDVRDGRSLLVELTSKGRRVIDEVVVAHTENENRLLASLSAAERKQLADLLRQLLLQFEDHPPKARRSSGGKAVHATARSSRRRSAGVTLTVGTVTVGPHA